VICYKLRVRDSSSETHAVCLRPFSIAVALPARAERALKICSHGRDGSKKQWTLRPRGQSDVNGKRPLRHPVLTRKSRSRRPSEYEIVEKSRSPQHDFSKKQRKLPFFFQK
jgi:hypothetical protein